MESSTKPSSLATWVVGILVAIVLAALIVPGFLSSQRASNERSAAAMLKTLTSAESDFRANDRDGNGVPDFWTKDVAGLYHLVPPGSSEPIQLISKDLANADPTRPCAKTMPGYWFEAMDKDQEGLDYRQGPRKDRNPTRLGFLARPEDRSTGRSVFYVNEGNTIFRRSIDLPLLRRWLSVEEMTNSQRDW
jgi:type II secretory pathway pseudopilin PulG